MAGWRWWRGELLPAMPTGRSIPMRASARVGRAEIASWIRCACPLKSRSVGTDLRPGAPGWKAGEYPVKPAANHATSSQVHGPVRPSNSFRNEFLAASRCSMPSGSTSSTSPSSSRPWQLVSRPRPMRSCGISCRAPAFRSGRRSRRDKARFYSMAPGQCRRVRRHPLSITGEGRRRRS